MSEIEVRHVPAGTGSALWVVGDTYTLKADKASTGGLFSLIEASVPPGGGPPPHTHTIEDEAFYLLEGVLEFQAGERCTTAGAGDFVYLPRYVPHRFTNPGDTTARALMLITPAGFEAFFAELGTPARPGGNPPELSPDELAAAVGAVARYGGRIHLPGVDRA